MNGQLRKKLIKIASLARQHIGQNNVRLFISALESKINKKQLNCAKIKRFLRAIDVEELSCVWHVPETPGWLYQYYLAPELDIFRSQSAPKVQSHQLAMRTHQCTPRWIADFLAQNTIGRYWLEMHLDSLLINSMPYFIPMKNVCKRAGKPVSEIKILDPACGAMLLGLSAFDLLERMYREELNNAGKKCWPKRPSVQSEDEIYEAIIRNNLFGVDIDAYAVKFSELAFSIRFKSQCKKLNILIADTLNGNLSEKMRRKKFPSSFDIVLLNPPYLDKRDYNSELKAFMSKRYGRIGRNLYSAFLVRASDLLADSGLMGAITPQTFMFIKSYQPVREFLLKNLTIEVFTHTGLNTFADAVVDCAFYVMRKGFCCEQKRKSYFIKLTEEPTPTDKQLALHECIDEMRKTGKSKKIYRIDTNDFSSLPGKVWVYWISNSMRRLFREFGRLGDIAEIRQGLATTDNKKFVRYFWEIPYDEIRADCKNLLQAARSGKKWFLYLKGGNSCKWFGNRQLVVNWKNNGYEIKREIAKRYPYLKGRWEWVAKNSEYYFREGITYSYLTSGIFSARYMPAGSIFDVAGSAIFARNREELYVVLGILNSRLARFLLSLINHTVNFQIGDLRNLPIPEISDCQELIFSVKQAIDLARQLEGFEETSFDFVRPPDWPDGIEQIADIHSRLEKIQQRIDELVFELYNISKADKRRICAMFDSKGRYKTFSREELAYRWVSFAIGIVFGRFSIETESHYVRKNVTRSMFLLSCENKGLTKITKDILIDLLGAGAVEELISSLGNSCNLSDYLREEFFIRHYRHYRYKPIYWLVEKGSELYCCYYHKLSNKFDFDEGISANLKCICPDWNEKKYPFPLDFSCLS